MLQSSTILRISISILIRNAIRIHCCSDVKSRLVDRQFTNMISDQNSIHGGQIKEVHEVPFNVLIRPFPSELDENKVLSLMKTLQNEGSQNVVPPIDVLWVTGKEGGNYYYSFGGCHRYEAHRRLLLPTIRSKLIHSTIEDLRTYLGSSTPDLK